MSPGRQKNHARSPQQLERCIRDPVAKINTLLCTLILNMVPDYFLIVLLAQHLLSVFVFVCQETDRFCQHVAVLPMSQTRSVRYRHEHTDPRNIVNRHFEVAVYMGVLLEWECPACRVHSNLHLPNYPEVYHCHHTQATYPDSL
jgi:hypothetical protein